MTRRSANLLASEATAGIETRDEGFADLSPICRNALTNSFAISQISLPADPTLTAQTSVVPAACANTICERRLIYSHRSAQEDRLASCLTISRFSIITPGNRAVSGLALPPAYS